MPNTIPAAGEAMPKRKFDISDLENPIEEARTVTLTEEQVHGIQYMARQVRLLSLELERGFDLALGREETA